MELTLTDGISGLALLVAILSAVSSGKSADSAESSAASARRANELVQHNERLAIYKSLQKFSFELHARGTELPDIALWEFYDAANISEFYYPQAVAKQLVDIADAANRCLAMRDLWRGYREGGASQIESARNALKSLHEQGSALRNQCKDADEALRAYLRLEAKPEE